MMKTAPVVRNSIVWTEKLNPGTATAPGMEAMKSENAHPWPAARMTVR
jgi:hypothetical protein